MRRLLAAFCLLWLLQGAALARPKVILVLANHLSLSDLKSSSYYDGLCSVKGAPSWFVDKFSPKAVVSPGLPDKKSPIKACYLRMEDPIGSANAFGPALTPSPLQGARIAVIGTTDGDDTYSPDYVDLLLPTQREQLFPEIRSPNAPGGLADDPEVFCASTNQALTTCDLVIVQWGDLDRIQGEVSSHSILPSVAEGDRNRAISALGRFVARLGLGHWSTGASPTWLVLASPVPRLDGNGGWNSLTPFVAVRLDTPGGPLAYSSATTQTNNLIAQRDIAPTLLKLLGRPSDPRLSGSPATGGIETVKLTYDAGDLDVKTRNNQIVESPFFWTMGFLLGFIGFGIVAALCSPPTAQSVRWSSYGLKLITVWPGAMLVGALVPAPNPAVYFASLYALMFLLALLPSVRFILVATSILLIFDCLTGSHMIAQSLLSAYMLSGIRFYGIGNEYMGVLIAGTLCACQWICEKLTSTNGTIRTSSWRLPSFLLFVLVGVVMSCPSFGAKAGAAITCGVTFAAAYGILSTGNLRVRHVAVGLLAGALMLAFWIAASPLLGLRQTHLQNAYASVGAGKSHAVLAMVASKLTLAFTVLTHPGTIIGSIALIVFGLTVQRVLRSQIELLSKKHPSTRPLYTACLTGCVACVVFNDSGIVAAILLFSLTVAGLLYGILILRCE